MHETPMTEPLFSYGTLQNEAVQLATFGRKLAGTPDILIGYRLSMIAIDDPEVVATSGEAHHPIVAFTGDAFDEVHGTVFSITPEELQQADAYEVNDYHRVRVQLETGTDAWVYVRK